MSISKHSSTLSTSTSDKNSIRHKRIVSWLSIGTVLFSSIPLLWMDYFSMKMVPALADLYTSSGLDVPQPTLSLLYFSALQRDFFPFSHALVLCAIGLIALLIRLLQDKGWLALSVLLSLFPVSLLGLYILAVFFPLTALSSLDFPGSP